MSSSSGRGQTEPLAALVAVFALGIGLSLYAGTLGSTVSALTEEAEMAPTAADRLEDDASVFGRVQPPIGNAVDAARPNGYRMNATLRTEPRAWYGGAPRAKSADCATRGVSVRTAPGTIRSGRLEVCVWPER